MSSAARMTVETDSDSERTLLTWTNRVQLLVNPMLWPSMLAVVGVPALLIGIFFTFIARRIEYVVLVPLVFLAFVFAAIVATALTIDALGGIQATFTLTTRGARFVPGRGSAQSAFMPWNEITTIRVKASRHYVLLRGGWGDKPVGLYCTPENFREVLDLLRAHVGDRMPRASSARS